MSKENVALLGALGTMGFEAFKELWERKDRYDIVVLLYAAENNRSLWAPFARQAGIEVIPETGVVAGRGFKIVRGDAANNADVAETVKDVDWVLNAMACISPAADYAPGTAAAVNIAAVKSIVRALEAQPGGAKRIRLIHTGTVAETGDRLENIHCGRVGDPLHPSVFDYYAVTKIAGERAVLESNIRHWASLRMTFIMPTTWKAAFNLRDPIAFHHGFTGKPYTILKAGHWCPVCLPPPWDDAAQARENPFFAQVWYVNHDPDENEFYPAHGTRDIVGADRRNRN